MNRSILFEWHGQPAHAKSSTHGQDVRAAFSCKAKRLFSILILLLPLKAMACGLDWGEPTSHFENVDFQGNVDIIRKLAEVEGLPIYLIFNSTYGQSPYAGAGFEIPLLESKFFQVDENRFVMKTPSGWLWLFQRSKVPDVLDGSAGWKGVIKDDTITVWADCGSKIVFKKGRIASMQLKDKKFTYSYRGNRVESIQQDGKPILEVGDDGTINLPLTRERIGLQQFGARPRVEIVSGEPLVVGTDQTLSEVTKPDGTKETFEFGVDDKMNPTLKLADKTIAWNPTTKKIIQDAEWTYQITPGTDIFAHAAIGRKNAKGQEEFWHYDGAKGQEVVRSTDGETETSSWFTSGMLVGRERERTITFKNGKSLSHKFFYDENGKVIRETKEVSRDLSWNPNAAITKQETFRDTNGDVTEILENGAVTFQLAKNPDNADFSVPQTGTFRVFQKMEDGTTKLLMYENGKPKGALILDKENNVIGLQ